MKIDKEKIILYTIILILIMILGILIIKITSTLKEDSINYQEITSSQKSIYELIVKNVLYEGTLNEEFTPFYGTIAYDNKITTIKGDGSEETFEKEAIHFSVGLYSTGYGTLSLQLYKDGKYLDTVSTSIEEGYIYIEV